MFNTIISLVIAGTISASGANYLLQLEEASEDVAINYVDSAEERFAEYERMIPGIVKWEKQTERTKQSNNLTIN